MLVIAATAAAMRLRREEEWRTLVHHVEVEEAASMSGSIELVKFVQSKGELVDWSRLVESVSAWATVNSVRLADTVVLAPFAQQLNAIRSEFARAAGWPPRVETSFTLAEAARDADADPTEGGVTFDLATDLLTAQRMLKSVEGLRKSFEHEPRWFRRTASEIVATAWEISKRANAIFPSAREAYWSSAAVAMEDGGGASELELMLGKVAFEWARAGSRGTGRVFELKAAAWVAVKGGGALDPLTAVLLERAAEQGTPVLLVDTDQAAGCIDIERLGAIDVMVCEDFEDEAGAAAARVLQAIEEGEVPVGLIANDRSLVRRTCALLARSGVRVNDETGWKFSTLRVGALVMSLMAASAWDASSDDVLNWLKGTEGSETTVERCDAAVGEIESLMRRNSWFRPDQVEVAKLSERAQSVWTKGCAIRDGLRGEAAVLSLGARLRSLRGAMELSGDWVHLQASDEGRQLIHALRLDEAAGRPQAWVDVCESAQMSFSDFKVFIGDIMEAASHVPAMASEDLAQVIVTPMPRAMLRQIKTMVVPGTDEQSMGAGVNGHPLLTERAVEALLLQTVDAKRERETVAFEHLLRAPRVTLLRRARNGSEPLAASALVQSAEQRRMEQTGSGFDRWEDAREAERISARPQQRPGPVISNSMPAKLSATSIEALRDCPYKFFGKVTLGLREQRELGGELDKRDMGTWLHQVLYVFHRDREEGASEAAEVARLLTIGRGEAQSLGIDAVSMVMFWASFKNLAPRYVAWQRARDAEGKRWVNGEEEIEVAIPEWGGAVLVGRLDRTDEAVGGDEVLDYKTTRKDELQKRARSGLEDTQLSTYGVLRVRSRAEKEGAGCKRRPVAGMYLGLDEKDGVAEVRVEGVDELGEEFIAGLGGDLVQMRAGVPLEALGEGQACETCTERGLCRRDHWHPVRIDRKAAAALPVA